MAQQSESELFNQRYKKAKARADQWSPLLERCFYFAVPFRNRFYRPVESQGEFRGKYLYDETGVEATADFVSSLHNVMTPPQVQWGFLEPEIDPSQADKVRPEDIVASRGILSEYMRNLFSYIHTSNFDTVVNECYFDVAVGTACLVPSWFEVGKEKKMLYTSIPIDELAIEESLDGKIRTWFRRWQDVKIREIQSKWKVAQLTQMLQGNMRENVDATVNLVEGVTWDPYNADNPYTYSLYAENDMENPLFKQFKKYNPGIIWRFQKTNNEWWGRGPVMNALAAMMRCNEMARIELASANLNTFRPYMAFSDGVFNPFTFRLEPFSVIPIARLSRDQPEPLIPLPDSSNPAFAQLTIADLRNQIKMLMYSDPLGPVDGPAKTATEQAIRQQRLSEKIGPMFTRLQQEFLWPIIETTGLILDEVGKLPFPKLPNGQRIRFKYRSPLALAKGQSDIAMLTQFVQLLQGMMGPETAQAILNPLETPYLMAEMLQVDNRFLNTPEVMGQIAEKLSAEQDKMQMMQEEQQNAQMANVSSQQLPSEV